MNKPSSSSSILSHRLGGLRLSGSVALRGYSRNVASRPILLGVTVKQVMGLPALLETPLKGPYIRRDAERCARFYGLPWRPPTPMTFSSVAAARAVVWAVAQRDLDIEAFVLGLYRHAWAEAADISTPESEFLHYLGNW